MSLSKNINPSLVLVQPRKTRPYRTERLLMGRKESNQTNKTRQAPLVGCVVYNYGFVLYIFSFCALSDNCLPEKGISDSVVVGSLYMLVLWLLYHTILVL